MLMRDGFLWRSVLDILTIVLISIGLSMDAFAVSLGVGTCGQIKDLRGKIRLPLHFGIFQSGMTVLGWVAGFTIVQYVSRFDHWIAFGLLAWVGINLVKSSFDKDSKAFDCDPSTGKMLVILSVATSIDALAVGLSIAFIQVPVLLSVIMIGVVAFLFSIVGISMGARLGESFGKRMELLGGIILLFIGIRIVITHLIT